MANSDRRRAEHTERPLTNEERRFAEDHHDLMYVYMKTHDLDFEEWYDILIIPYLQAVKKYFQYEKLQKLRFEQVFFRTLDNARGNYYRDMNRQKRMPEGGIYSYDALLEDGNTFEKYIIDIYTNVEHQVIFKELYKEFYEKCSHLNNFFETDIYKDEIDMLIAGYSFKKILRKTLKKYGGCDDDGFYTWALENDIEKFRKCFKQVFGI